MSDIVKQVEALVKQKSDEYKAADKGEYDFWKNHIKYVRREALRLAEKYQADLEIVELGALLHDIAQMFPGATKKDHEIKGRELAEKILIGYDYPKDKRERVLGCVLHHRSSKNAENIEELCVADADVLAHFDNIPMLFDAAYHVHGMVGVDNVRKFMSDTFTKDFDDLSDKTKAEFVERYHIIRGAVLGE